MDDGSRTDQVFDGESQGLLFLPAFARGDDTDPRTILLLFVGQDGSVSESSSESRQVAGRQGKRGAIGRRKDQ